MDINMAYLNALLRLCGDIKDPTQQFIFRFACKRYQDFIRGKAFTKRITKKELIESLINIGMMSRVFNPDTKAYDKLPDDRPVREAARELLKQGFPLLSDAGEAGFYIADNPKEVDKPQAQNSRRGKRVLEADKGYNRMREFLLGQTSFL